MSRGRVVVVTGTGTGVGKTVVTAALAAVTPGPRTVVKPVQTGVPADVADVDTVHALTGCAGQELVALEDPLAPDTAARLRGVRIPPVAEHADRVRVLAEEGGTVVVEGAGGLLVRLDTDGGTLLDLVLLLRASGTPVEVLVVVGAGLGTLNATELTVRALRAEGVEPAGLVIGAWPSVPGLAERCNLEDLPRVTGVPLLGRVPEGAGALGRAGFLAAARDWLPGWAERRVG